MTSRSESAGAGYFAIHDRGIDGKLLFDADRFQRDAEASLARGSHVELRGLAGRGDRLRLRLRGADRAETEADDEQQREA